MLCFRSVVHSSTLRLLDEETGIPSSVWFPMSSQQSNGFGNLIYLNFICCRTRGSNSYDMYMQVYVRPAGSYVMDRLELRRVTFYPGVNGADIVILVGNFGIPTGLRVAEAALSSQQV